MATTRSAKAGQKGHRGAGSGKKSDGLPQFPLSRWLMRRQAEPLSEVSDRQGLSRPSEITLIAIVVAGAALPYLNTLRNGFVADDVDQVVQNPFIRSFHQGARIFTSWVASYDPWWPHYYRPLMNVGYLLCYQIFGLHPFGFHLVNLVLHLTVVAAVFLITERIFQDHRMALMAAVLFAVHPIHCEAVAWVAAVSDLELTLFYLLTFWLFLEVARPGGGFSYPAQLAMAGSFLLTIFAKETAVTLPLLATIYEHFYRHDRRETRLHQKVVRYAALWVLSAAYLLFRVRVLGSLGSGYGRKDLTWYETFLSGLLLAGRYFRNAFWPVNLRVLCPFRVSGLFDPALLGSAVALAGCGAVFFFLWRRAKLVSFGLVWMLVTLAPVLNVRWMPIFPFADRYLYLPSVGFCWVLGWGLLWLWIKAAARGRVWTWAFSTAFVLLLGLCSLRIITRNRIWQNNVALYTDILAACPDTHNVRVRLGEAYWDMGNQTSATAEWEKELEQAPRDLDALNHLRPVFQEKEHQSEAIEFLQKILTVDPGNGPVHLALGFTYMDANSLALAEAEFRSAASSSPADPGAPNALGRLYLVEGRTAEAEEQFHRSVGIKPNLIGYSNLGMIDWRRGDAESAEQEWREALRLAPNDSSILNDLGLVSMSQGRYTEAIAYFRQAAGLKPNDPLPHLNLGIAYGKLGQKGTAEAEFRAALSLNPANSQGHFQLGSLYDSEGRREEALKEYQADLKSDPSDREALAAVQKLRGRVRD
jgi:Flp pilus assembly protein TadD